MSLFGRAESANPLQLMARLVASVGVIVGALGVASTLVVDPDACYPNCEVNPERVTAAQAEYYEQQIATPDSIEAPITVAVYGDSRGWYLAEGTKLVSGWIVSNEARQGCVFLAQDRVFERYDPDGAPRERSVSVQTTGETVTCDPRLYIPSLHVDMAIVYAGTLLTVDTGTDENLHSPLEPAYAAYIESNVATILANIAATKIVVVSTPQSLDTWDAAGHFRSDSWLWAQRDRIDAVNAILERAASTVGATYLSGFGAWVEAQPVECQPDGSHFTVECALEAAMWIRAAVK